MSKNIDVCSAMINNKVVHFYRVRSDREVEAVYEVSADEYGEINELLNRKGYEGILTRILGLHSFCFTYHDVDDVTVNEIVITFGRLFPREGGG